MTIGVAIVLGRGVVAVADGRVTNALNQADRLIDDCDKIDLVHRTLLAVVCGVEMVSRRAAQEVRAYGSSDPQVPLRGAELGVGYGWELLRTQHPIEYGANDFMAALLLAGIAPTGLPYVALVQQKKDSPMSLDGPHTKPLRYGIAATDDDATRHTEHALAKVAANLPRDDREAAAALASAVAQAIRETARRSRTVGGRVRAVYLAAGCAAEDLVV